MENTVKMSMEAYMDSLRSDITTINEQPENECCDAVEIKVLENVLGIMNAHFGDYDTFCSENKAMATFLESLGYSHEQITDIANGEKPKLETLSSFFIASVGGGDLRHCDTLAEALQNSVVARYHNPNFIIEEAVVIKKHLASDYLGMEATNEKN
ncbi:hypothetical protein [Sulfurospirillum multivorans]|uniref:Uncharacterized protein n=2 Tax=Sulfurospirillum multivorans TaxID=66821 RepID=A0AA86E2T4_SULMK|nr:hypothetical protein [Sulfurospirillum multivorans]AHJ13062.1 hypothetical protein SMUL_1807 [Sulfurospirillum multivorans DSM 12446]QEH06550.1 hypothetical protein SMN_1785 [Sulfurospirillum multivorans]